MISLLIIQRILGQIYGKNSKFFIDETYTSIDANVIRIDALVRIIP